LLLKFCPTLSQQAIRGKPTTSSALALTFFDKHFQNPSVQQTDLTIEREIAKNTVVSMSYIGSVGRSLPDFVDVNTGPAVTDITYTVSGNGPVPAGTYTTPFYGTSSTVVKDSGGSVVSTSSAGRPNPTYGSLTDIFSGVSSNYHASAATEPQNDQPPAIHDQLYLGARARLRTKRFHLRGYE
jgi:hypothetical protein